MKWMAKGLTHSEEEAECHFSELVDRNIFTLVPPTGEHNLDEAEPSLEPPTKRPFSEICMPRWVALHSPVPDIQGLSVRKTQVSKLPPQIKELCSLRTLDVSHTQISKLPSQAFELGQLIKLDLRSTKIRMLSEKIVGLQNLQHLLVGGDTTLSLIKYPLSFTAALGDLACLRVLTITCSFQQCSDEAYQDAWLSSMKKWSQLESLTIHCGPGSSMEFLGSTSCDGIVNVHHNTMLLLQVRNRPTASFTCKLAKAI